MIGRLLAWPMRRRHARWAEAQARAWWAANYPGHDIVFTRSGDPPPEPREGPYLARPADGVTP